MTSQSTFFRSDSMYPTRIIEIYQSNSPTSHTKGNRAINKKTKGRVQCEYCKKSYTNMNCKQKHIRNYCLANENRIRQPIECEYCHRIYSNRNNKIKHVQFNCRVLRQKLDELELMITDDGSLLFDEKQAAELDAIKLDI
jgi:hypothetical protein